VPRSERLLNLLQTLRRARTAVTGSVLAQELGISIRTLYRDIASLQSLGAVVVGEPGVGYVLRGGLLLPPLMFTKDEIEALVLGSRWVEKRADPRLASAGTDVLAKIAAVLPRDLRQELETSTLLVGPREPLTTEAIDAAVLRQAIRSESKVRITYKDAKGRTAAGSSGRSQLGILRTHACWWRGAKPAKSSVISGPIACLSLLS
jgi:predicted DNA-binding transcriptional regulator YafY